MAWGRSRRSPLGQGGGKMFKTGQKVVHHSYGAGVITAIEEQMLDSQTRRYYVIALTDAGKDSQLMVPEDRVSKRLRPLASGQELRRAMKVLSSKPRELPTDVKERTALITERLSSRETLRTAEVIRDLAWRHRQKRASRSDDKLLKRALEMLAREVALQQGIGMEEAAAQLQAKIAVQET
ncbi:MAG: hypothetical protein DRI52_00400 [Chloroflexi bacterium]|nr:MAG: hypothetical protein DRI52_00400 [Chloroflexota bacterium]